MDRIFEIHNLPRDSKTIQKIEDLTEVKSMLETNTKNWEKAVLEKGIGTGIEKGYEIVAEKSIARGMSNEDIRAITGLSLSKILQIRKKIKKSNFKK